MRSCGTSFECDSAPLELFSKYKTVVRPERLLRRCAPRPCGSTVACAPVSNLACGQVVELGLLSVGSSNLRRRGPTGSWQYSMRKTVVRPERFDLLEAPTGPLKRRFRTIASVVFVTV